MCIFVIVKMAMHWLVGWLINGWSVTCIFPKALYYLLLKKVDDFFNDFSNNSDHYESAFNTLMSLIHIHNEKFATFFIQSKYTKTTLILL